MKESLKYYYSIKREFFLFIVGAGSIILSIYFFWKFGINFFGPYFFFYLVATGAFIIGIILCWSFLLIIQNGRMLAVVVDMKGIKIIARDDWAGKVAFTEFVKWEDVYSVDIGRDYHTALSGDGIDFGMDVLRKIVIRLTPGTLQDTHNAVTSSYIPFTTLAGERETMPGKTITLYKYDDNHPYDEMTINIVLNKNKKQVCLEIKQFITNNIDSNRLQSEFKESLQTECVNKSINYFS